MALYAVLVGDVRRVGHAGNLMRHPRTYDDITPSEIPWLIVQRDRLWDIVEARAMLLRHSRGTNQYGEASSTRERYEDAKDALLRFDESPEGQRLISWRNE